MNRYTLARETSWYHTLHGYLQTVFIKKYLRKNEAHTLTVQISSVHIYFGDLFSPVGPLDFPRSAWGLWIATHSNSAQGPRSNTRLAAFERTYNNMTKLHRPFFGPGQRSGQQRSSKVKIDPFQILFRQTGA